MIAIQRHDARLAPVGFWQFDGDMNDYSGNAVHLSIESGNERYAYMCPGIRGFYFDGSTRIIASSTSSAVQLTGDMAFMALAHITAQHDTDSVNNPTIICCGDFSTSGEDNNQLYDFNVVTGGGVSWYHEHDDSVGVSRSTIYGINQGTVCHVAWVRDTAYHLYVNGKLQASTSTFTSPTGGTNGKVRFGSAGPALSGDPILSNSIISSAMLLDYAPTSDQVKQAYLRTLGHRWGAR